MFAHYYVIIFIYFYNLLLLLYGIPVSSFEEEQSFPNEQLENNSNVKKVGYPFLILQVFNEDTRSLEISQSCTITQREFSDCSVPCKKRKIELGWDVIKDHLQKSQNDFELVPW